MIDQPSHLSHLREEGRPALPGQSARPVLNALTVDVEDYYQVSAFEGCVRFDDWPTYESRVENNTWRVLDLLDEYGVKATFFVLGWQAERRPKLVEEIAERGHEIASHGYRHRLVYSMTPAECRDDLLRAKSCLEDITGARVLGFRAPSFSIVTRSMWCLDLLIELGFRYDSSIFPTRHDRYGIPGAPRVPHLIRRGRESIVEFPPATARLGGLNVPVAGGAYLRFFPLTLIRYGLRRINDVEGQPVMMYFHPWEIDPDQPRLDAPMTSRLRHYRNLDKTEAKLRQLLTEFSFGPARVVLAGRGLM